ncbi:MAG: vWA domain-containing protein, partial [Verrucomicrobiota bacterium]
MTFAQPWVLLLLVFPVLLGVWEWKRKGHPLAVPLDHGDHGSGGLLRRLIVSASLITPMLLAVAILLLARPQKLAQPNHERVLTNIEFCLDVSGSMNSSFGDGKRADKAIEAIIDFTSYRKGDAFGLTIFGTDVVHWVPITRDLSAIRLAAPFLRPDRMPPIMGGTRIGRALRSVKDILASRPTGDRMIILISDGTSSDLRGGMAQTIGEELRAEDIMVNYIHVANGEPQQETYELTRLSGGEAFLAGDPAGLRDVFDQISAMKPIRMKPKAPEYVDYFRPFGLFGLGLLGL